MPTLRAFVATTISASWRDLGIMSTWAETVLALFKVSKSILSLAEFATRTCNDFRHKFVN